MSRQRCWSGLAGKLLLGSLFVCLLLSYLVAIQTKWQTHFVSDFALFYESGQAASQHHSLYQQFPRARYQFPKQPILGDHHLRYSANLNTPFFNLLLQPLMQFDYVRAWQFWLLITAACFGLSIYFLIESGQRFYYALAMLAAFPSYLTVQIGQLSFQLLLLLALAGWAALREKQGLLGALLALLCSLKLFFGLYVFYLLLFRYYRGLLVMMIGFVGLAALAASHYGLAVYHDYGLALQQIRWYGASWNVSLWGMLARLGYWPTHVGVRAGCVLLGCLLLWFPLRFIVAHAHCRRQALQLAFCFVLISCLLLSPLGWLYYFPLLLLPVLALRPYCSQFNPIVPSLVMMCCLFLGSLPSHLVLSELIQPSWLNLIKYAPGFYALLLLLSLILYSVGRPELAEAGEASWTTGLWLVAAGGALMPSAVFILRVAMENLTRVVA